jgi:hypothetical protein
MCALMIEKTVTCPNCGAPVEMRIARTTNRLGGRAADFRPVAEGGQPVAQLVHTCPWCGLSGEERAFAEQVDDRLRTLIAQRLTPLVRAEPPAASRRHEFAAWLAEWRGRPAGTVAQYHLSAAWCCEDPAAEADHRRRAIAHFERALAQDELGGRERVVFTYLVGELHRRLGHPREAAEWFGRAEDLARAGEEAWVEALARRQATDPQDLL